MTELAVSSQARRLTQEEKKQYRERGYVKKLRATQVP